MKSSIRILNMVFLTAIYCFAIGAVSNSYAYSDFSNNQTSSEEKISSNFSSTLFYHTSQSESSLNSFNNLPVPNFKNSFTGLWAIINASEQLFQTNFVQYSTFSRNLLIRHRKSDIIFQFNYFW